MVTTRCGPDWRARNFPLGPWLQPASPLLKVAPSKEDFCLRKVCLLRPEVRACASASATRCRADGLRFQGMPPCPQCRHGGHVCTRG